MSKLKSPWFKHWSNTNEDARFVRLLRIGGYAFIGMFWAFAERLQEREDYSLPIDDVDEVLFHIHIPEADRNAFINKCIESKLLARNDSVIYSPWLNEQMVEYESKCETNRNNRLGKKKDEERPLTTDEPSKTVVVSASSSTSSSNSSVLEGGPGETNWRRAFPKLDNPECRKALENWALHVHQKFRRHLDEMAKHALLSRYSTNPQGFLIDVAWSIENGWRTINAKPKQEVKPIPKNAPPDPGRRIVPDAQATKAMLNRIFDEADRRKGVA